MEEIQDWLSKGKKASAKLKKIERGISNGEIELDVDESKLTFENRHNLNEVELYALLERNQVPKGPYISLAVFTVSYFSLATYLFIKNGQALIKKLIPKHKMTLGNMVVKGTCIASGGVGLYAVLGLALVKQSNIYEDYIRYTRIKETLIDKSLKEDEALQKMYLLDNMEYYGMPQSMIDEAKRVLDERRQKMKEEKSLIIYLLDDDEEDELEED